MENINENNAYDAYDGYDAFSKGMTGLTFNSRKRTLLSLGETDLN